jgi:uncharacterized membrane protein (DUF373 family)
VIPWKRAALFGVLSWIPPFVLSFALFHLKRSNPGLFESLMTLIVLLTAGALFPLYFRNRSVSVREAVAAGAVWLAANLVLDYPMFAYGPMKMTATAYYSEIGLDYLIFPLYALGAAWLARTQAPGAPGA